MNVYQRKSKYWRIGNERVAQIQAYFLTTGDTDKNIAAKFGIELSSAMRITHDALLKYQNGIKESKAQIATENS